MTDTKAHREFFVPPVRFDDAGGDLAKIYAEIAGARGGVANIITCTGANPTAVETHFRLYKAVMFGPSPLSRAERELVAVAVSIANQCHY